MVLGSLPTRATTSLYMQILLYGFSFRQTSQLFDVYISFVIKWSWLSPFVFQYLFLTLPYTVVVVYDKFVCSFCYRGDGDGCTYPYNAALLCIWHLITKIILAHQTEIATLFAWVIKFHLTQVFSPRLKKYAKPWNKPDFGGCCARKRI